MTSLNFSSTLGRFGLDAVMKKAGAVVLGYSGGPDSSCLLRLLADWCAENGVALAAAHVNHGIRGEEADRDEAFCRRTCAEMGVPLHVKRADVPALARDLGQGLEECARDVRYAFFDEVSRRLTGDPRGAAVATAHNATDHLETVLCHLFRGAGTHGLGGIPPIRDGRIVRPLLGDTSEAVRAWCRENGIPSVEDGTNSLPDCTRNVVRLNVLPEIRRIFASPEEAVLRMSGLARMDDACLEALARAQIEENGISRARLTALDPALSSRVLRILAGRAGGKIPEERHIRDVLALAKEPGGRRVSLPGGVECVMDGGFVTVRAPSAEPEGFPPFRYPGDGDRFENPLCTLAFRTGDPFPPDAPDSLGDGGGDVENIYKIFISVSLNFDKMKGALQIRARKPGDTVRFGGMTRRVKTLFSDRKIPVSDRPLVPVLEDGDGIVWIPGFPPRDGVRWEGDGVPLTVICGYRKSF